MLINQISDVHNALRVAYQEFQFENKNTTARVTTIGAKLLETIHDLDTLLGTDVNFMVGVWISMARAWGNTTAEVRVSSVCGRAAPVVYFARWMRVCVCVCVRVCVVCEGVCVCVCVCVCVWVANGNLLFPASRKTTRSSMRATKSLSGYVALTVHHLA